MDKRSLFVCVLNRGKANSFLNEMRGFGLSGGLVLLGEGTSRNKVLEFFGLDETQKEVIFLPPIEEYYVRAIHELLLEQFQINKKRTGIAFSIPLSQYEGESILPEGKQYDPESFDYQCIFVVVDEGKGKTVMKYIHEIGQYGATIMHGHGAGVPTKGYFPLNIEPQKDIVMLLVKSENAEKIEKHLHKECGFEEPGTGIIYTLPVSRITGKRGD